MNRKLAAARALVRNRALPVPERRRDLNQLTVVIICLFGCAGLRLFCFAMIFQQACSCTYAESIVISVSAEATWASTIGRKWVAGLFLSR
jgi:hypothetical protein